MSKVKILSLISLLLLMCNCATAEKVCLKAKIKGNSVKLKKSLSNICPSNTTEFLDLDTLKPPQGPQGPNGPAGIKGLDGALKKYGDGSSGNLVVSGYYFPILTNQYENIIVEPGGHLEVSPGSIIRCRGTFVNNGLVTVSDTSDGGGITQNTEPAGASGIQFSNPGIAKSIASSGQFTINNSAALGGAGGIGLGFAGATNIINRLYVKGGGSGMSTEYNGGNGVGALVILCQNGIVNNGTIDATPEQAFGRSAGGAGGGIIILASKDSVQNTGLISANGGKGGNSWDTGGAGGGGGGGIVELIAPNITNTGLISVAGGQVGSTSNTTTSFYRFGGGGGGGSGGDGGKGMNVAANGTQSGGTAGSLGVTIINITDPTAFF